MPFSDFGPTAGTEDAAALRFIIRERKAVRVMNRDFEKMLVGQCAPTLAGIKPANLFRFSGSGRAIKREVSYWDKELSRHGISVEIIKECPRTDSVLVYVYRKEWLEEILSGSEIREFLEGKGYARAENCGRFLEQLSERLCLEEEFPHEVGIFLGYPLEDVIGFIENKGQNYTSCGFWKTYGDPREAGNRFDGYRACINLFMKRFENGTPVIQLLRAV